MGMGLQKSKNKPNEDTFIPAYWKHTHREPINFINIIIISSLINIIIIMKNTISNNSLIYHPNIHSKHDHPTTNMFTPRRHL